MNRERGVSEPIWPSLPEGFRFRLARESDGSALAGLMEEYFRELGLERDTGGLDHDLGDPARAYRGGGLVLLLRDNRLCGCLGVRRLEPGRGELKRMYLRPGARGRGLGAALLQAGLALARKKGFSRLVLDTRRDLAAANLLYERAGFVDIADYNQNPRAERFMCLEL